MAYDTYGRPLRSNADQPGYFGIHDSIPDTDYTNYHPSEPRGRDPSLRRREWDNSRPRRSPSIDDTKMPSETGISEAASVDSLSADAIAALTAEITERVKKELVEHLKQSGNIDDSIKATPMQRDSSNRSNSSSSPPPTTRRVYTPPSPVQPARTMYGSSSSQEPLPRRSPPASPLDKPTNVRFSERNARPAVARTYSTLELSTIDQKWGRLFDSEGNPTRRLGEFLRGLANHIICSFLPKGTIVVTPAKMVKYYESYSLEKEPHPLLAIFRAQSNELISQLYQELGCEHHLVQENAHSAPTIPALTPVGFAHWMTIHIIAYPDDEWNRLEKVVPQLPVDADGDLVDGKPERLPKQISRHLLPEREDRESRELIEGAIANFLDNLGSAPRRKASITNSPVNGRSSISQTRSHPVEIHQSKSSPTSSKVPPILERDRNPYGGPSGSDEETGPNNIERKRQPYSAQPGGAGKVYSDNVSGNLPNRTSRSNSTTTRPSRRESSDRTTNADNPRTRPHSNSTAGQGYIPTTRRSRRTSSPPMKSFRNTAPENISESSQYGAGQSSSAFGLNPGSYGATSSFPPPPGPPPININTREDTRDPNRRSREERPPWTAGFDDDGHREMNSPRDAERLDRYREAQERGGYERTSASIDPRDARGAPAEEWYRKEGRNNDYEYRRYA